MLDDVLKAMQQAGFKPVENSDEDFAPLEGEYAVKVSTLRPWVNEETDTKEAYMLQLSITQTLSGEQGDGRMLTRFYRIAGNGFNGEVLTDEQRAENIKRLCNDAFTIGAELDLNSEAALEASFEKLIEATGYARAWKQKRRDGNGFSQNFRIKVSGDLRKASTESAAGRTSRAPF